MDAQLCGGAVTKKSALKITPRLSALFVFCQDFVMIDVLFVTSFLRKTLFVPGSRISFQKYDRKSDRFF
jgi:hypothetical protein